MWKRIKDTTYFLSFSNDREYEICVTDYVGVWTSFYSEKAFVAQLKESNDGLEMEDSEFVQKGVYLLTNLDNLKKFGIESKENGKSLFITLTISLGFLFNFECKLLKGSEELYFQKVTRPLLNVICDIRESETELRRLLVRKDKQIEEYKSEGGEIVLRNLKTVPFNDEEHVQKYREYEKQFGACNKSPTFIKEVIELLEKNVLKQKPAVRPEPAPKIKIEAGPSTKIVPGPSIKMEPDTTVLTEPDPPVKQETTEETNAQVVTASVSFKQEIKRETLRAHVPRKRSRFNF